MKTAADTTLIQLAPTTLHYYQSNDINAIFNRIEQQ